MGILTRYMMRELSKLFLLCVTALLGLYYVVDIFDRIEIFIQYHAPVAVKLAYFLYKVPLIFYQVVPVSLLITIVIVLGVMSRNNELTAVKAAGVSLYTVTLPIVAFSLLVSVVVFMSNEYLLPYTNQRAAYLLDVRIKGKTPRGIFKQTHVWAAGKDNEIYNIQLLDPVQRLLEGVTIFRFDDKFRPVERIDALRARPEKGNWNLEHVVRRIFTEGGSRIKEVQQYASLVVPVAEDFESFYKYKKKPDEMNYGELRNYVRRIGSSGFNATPYRVDLIAKTAIPFISFVVSFLAIAMAVQGDRRGGMLTGIGFSIALTVGYWIFLSICLSLGHAGRLPPLLASWAPNILFASGGLYSYVNLKQ